MGHFMRMERHTGSCWLRYNRGGNSSGIKTNWPGYFVNVETPTWKPESCQADSEVVRDSKCSPCRNQTTSMRSNNQWLHNLDDEDFGKECTVRARSEVADCTRTKGGYTLAVIM